MNDTVNKLDFMDIARILHLTQSTCSSQVHMENLYNFTAKPVSRNNKIIDIQTKFFFTII